MADNPREFDYTTTATCDVCRVERTGTMLHQNDSMGDAVPVLFQCDRCSGKGVWKHVNRLRRIGQQARRRAWAITHPRKARANAARRRAMQAKLQAAREKRVASNQAA